VKEDEFNQPATMYGCNKLYCEQLRALLLGALQATLGRTVSRIDFRCVRFPGLISAVTVPSGGTFDYAPEMIHAPRRGSRTTASSAPTRGSRSWRCPMASRRF